MQRQASVKGTMHSPGGDVEAAGLPVVDRTSRSAHSIGLLQGRGLQPSFSMGNA